MRLATIPSTDDLVVYLSDPAGHTVGHLDFHVDARPDGPPPGDPSAGAPPMHAACCQASWTRSCVLVFSWRSRLALAVPHCSAALLSAGYWDSCGVGSGDLIDPHTLCHID